VIGISILFLGVTLATPVEAAPRVRPSTRFSQSFSKPRDTLNWESELAVRVWKKNEVRAFSNFERREFAGVVALRDIQAGAGSILFLHPQFYFDLAGAYTPKADFLPKWEAKAEPHWVVGTFDFSVGSRWRQYRREKTFSLKPAVLWEVSDYLRLGAFTDVSLKPERTVSGGMSANVTWSQAIQTRLSLSGGRSDEGDGIYDDFTDIHMSFLFPILVQLHLGLDGGFRMGELRDELSYGVSLGGSF